jgi:hypothetical protein
MSGAEAMNAAFVECGRGDLVEVLPEPAMPEPDPRTDRLAELPAELNRILAEFQGLEPGSAEREEVLKRYEPLLGAVMALGEELSED